MCLITQQGGWYDTPVIYVEKEFKDIWPGTGGSHSES